MQILRASFQNINQFAIGEICSFLIDSIVIVILMQVASAVGGLVWGSEVIEYIRIRIFFLES